MGPPGVLVENQAPKKDTADPHRQTRAIPHTEDRSPRGRDRAGREVGAVVPRSTRDAAGCGRPARSLPAS